MPLKCGLLGEKLVHSLSPEIHRRLGDYEYRLYEKKRDEVEDFLLHGGYDVLNVTIPYKKTAYRLCGELSPTAAELGNVNVVVKRLDGTLYGDNTDKAGFLKLVELAGVGADGKKCLVLGTGGAAQTARCALEGLGAADVVMISRSGENNYENLHLHRDAKIIVNATPVGMFPDTESQPVALKDFPECEAAIDLIYNPSPTKLLQEAASRGMAHIGGMAMLEEQARLASVHMNANLYLYGAPGSGKSTYAKKLAAGKSMPLVDLDAEIEKAQGRTIAEIFAVDGEAAFRRIEKAALEKTAAKRGQIVALGGGALLDGDSRRLAEATGRIVFIDCPEEELLRRVDASESRPLLAGDRRQRLHELLIARREHYASFKERISGISSD